MATPPDDTCTGCCTVTIAVRGVRTENSARGFAPFNGLGPDRFLTKSADYSGYEFDPPGWGYGYGSFTMTGTRTQTAIPGGDPDPRNNVALPFAEGVEPLTCPPDSDECGECTPANPGTPPEFSYSNEVGTTVFFVYCDPIVTRTSHDIADPWRDVCLYESPYIEKSMLIERNKITLHALTSPEYYFPDDDYRAFNFDGSTTLSNADSIENVTSRLNAARASGHAYNISGIVKDDFDSFQDGVYPNLKYFNWQSGNYGVFHYTWRNACFPDVGGEGTVGFSLDPLVFGHGLDMAGNDYYKNKYAPFESAVAWAKRHEHNVAMFEGVFSTYTRGSVLSSMSIRFQKAEVPLWASLQKVILATLDPEDGGTNSQMIWNLTLEDPLNHPVDKLGSMNFAHASWDNVGLFFRNFNNSIDITGAAFKIAEFCTRHKTRVWSPSVCNVTIRKIVLNYKDSFDSDDGLGRPVQDQLISSPVIENGIVLECAIPMAGGFVSEEYFETPANNRQQIWIQIVSTDVVEATSIKIVSKERIGNFGFGQLDHAKDAVKWTRGIGKEFPGFRRNTQWYAKQVFTFSKNLYSFGSPAAACRVVDGTSLNFSTEITLEQPQDSGVKYEGWGQSTVRAIFTGHPWKYVEATSSNADVTIEAPTGEHYDYPPVWGPVNYDSFSSTSALRTVSDNSDNTIYLAHLSRSHVPTRHLFGSGRRDQDYWSNVFLQNQVPPEEWTSYDYPYEGEYCEEGNNVCGEFTCSKEPYSMQTHRVGGQATDPYFGYSLETQTSTSTITLSLTPGESGFYGEELPETEPGSGVYDESQLLPGETADSNGRIYSPILSSGIHVEPVPSSGTYIVYRNFRLVPAE